MLAENKLVNPYQFAKIAGNSIVAFHMECKPVTSQQVLNW